jgi:hypothetical protein
MPRRDTQPRPVNVRWQTIEHASCTRKRALTETEARAAVANDQPMNAYRCAFDNTHWHVGHNLKMKQLRKLAAALRLRQLDTSHEGA